MSSAKPSGCGSGRVHGAAILLLGVPSCDEGNLLLSALVVVDGTNWNVGEADPGHHDNNLPQPKSTFAPAVTAGKYVKCPGPVADLLKKMWMSARAGPSH